MITQGQTDSFKAELYQAIHDLPADTLKIALYTAAASLPLSTLVYSPAEEVVGAGYTAGGLTLTNVTVAYSGSTAYVSFDNPAWAGSSIVARGALVYNNSKADRSVVIIDFGADKTSNASTFTIALPANTAASALIRSV